MRFGFLTLLILVACEGPPGADGIDGIDGKKGKKGADGADGFDGNDGFDGQDGQDGVDGQDGFDAHFGESPWGLTLTIEDVTGGTGAGGALLAGNFPVITFSVYDDDGIPYDLAELDRVEFSLAGPSEHMQVVLDRNDLDDVETTSVYNGDGTWTYTSPVAIPATYAPPPNDTADIGLVDGDWGGEALVDGTYRLVAWASLEHLWIDGTEWTEADGATWDVVIGASNPPLEPHEVVLADSCVDCHGSTLYQHGGSRGDPDVCVGCHVAGAEDRYSQTDPLTTPGVTVAMDAMIHGIHMGLDRPDALLINGYPADPTLPGYPDYNTHDFSEIGFPVWPDGVKDCAICHAGAAQGDVENRPDAAACQGCHSDVDVRSGTNHLGGVQPDDTMCANCHSGTDILGYHASLRDDPALNPGNTVTVLGVTGGTGPSGAFQVGDTVTVEFSAVDDSGTALDLTAAAFSEVVFSGPTTHFQRVLVSGFGDVPASAVYDSVNNSYTYDLGTIPATYPAQANATADLGIEVGEWEGLPLVDGTYRAVVAIGMDVTDGVDTERVASSHTMDVLFGAATALEPRDVVTEANCETCHSEIVFHGDNRKGLDGCLTCHTAGAEDRYSIDDPLTTPGVSIAFGTVLHKIHNGSELSQVYEVNGYGFPYTTHQYNHVVFPRFDGGTSQCESCHAGNDAWETPSGLMCKTCHDDTATAAHVSLQTDPTYGESCEVCHGQTDALGVSAVHSWGTP